MVTLETSKLFSLVPPTELKKLSQGVHERQFGPGEQIFKEGDPGDGIYVVKEGRVQISAKLERGERQVLCEVLPGDVFGEMAVLDGQPRSAWATTDRLTITWFVPRQLIWNLLKACPEMAIYFVQEVSGRLREFNRQYLRKVLEAERMALVGRFASFIAHDLKNPLSVMSLSAELCRSETASPAMRQAAQQQMGWEIERMTELVNDIVEFTRGAAGAVTFTKVDYAGYVHGLVEQMKPEAAMQDIIFECENEPPAVQVALNTHRLNRVFHNLVSNAMDAVPKGGKIKLRFAATGSEVKTEIEDSGVGIAPEIAEHLFEAFATYGKERGTGLGLSICRKIVEEHGGTISACNQPGSGAVFSFTLPIAQ